MKTRGLCVGLLALAWFAVSLDSASAAPRSLRSRQLLEQFDTDGNGRLDNQERLAARRAQRLLRDQQAQQQAPANTSAAQTIARFDTNGDGQVDGNEFLAARAQLAQQLQANVAADNLNRLMQMQAGVQTSAGGDGSTGTGQQAGGCQTGGDETISTAAGLLGLQNGASAGEQGGTCTDTEGTPTSTTPSTAASIQSRQAAARSAQFGGSAIRMQGFGRGNAGIGAAGLRGGGFGGSRQFGGGRR